MRKLTLEEVKSALEVALETEADPDGGNEIEIINFDILTRALNDALENE
jgi:hypothetical protein